MLRSIPSKIGKRVAWDSDSINLYNHIFFTLNSNFWFSLKRTRETKSILGTVMSWFYFSST